MFKVLGTCGYNKQASCTSLCECTCLVFPKYIITIGSRLCHVNFPGGRVDENSPASTGDIGSIPDLGGFPMPWSSRVLELQLLNLRAATSEAPEPRAHAQQLEKSLQWEEARAPQWRIAPHSSPLGKVCKEQQWPSAARNQSNNQSRKKEKCFKKVCHPCR